jgi:hypothetical protein
MTSALEQLREQAATVARLLGKDFGEPAVGSAIAASIEALPLPSDTGAADELVERLRVWVRRFAEAGVEQKAITEAAAAITALKVRVAELEKERAAWLRSHRWNVETDGDDLLVCSGDHEKAEGCTYVRYVPALRSPQSQGVGK